MNWGEIIVRGREGKMFDDPLMDFFLQMQVLDSQVFTDFYFDNLNNLKN